MPCTIKRGPSSLLTRCGLTKPLPDYLPDLSACLPARPCPPHLALTGNLHFIPERVPELKCCATAIFKLCHPNPQPVIKWLCPVDLIPGEEVGSANTPSIIIVINWRINLIIRERARARVQLCRPSSVGAGAGAELELELFPLKGENM